MPIKARHGSLLFAAALSVLLGACATRPPRVPEVPVAAQYGLGDSARNAPVTPFVSGTQVAQMDEWWTQFGDARLARLVSRVRERNTDLVVAGLRLQRARLVAGLAFDATLPHLDASASAGRTERLRGDEPGTHSYGASASLGYEVDFWGRLRAQHTVARWEAEATEQDLHTTALLLVTETCNLYWNLAFLNERIAAGEESLEHLRRTLALVETQYKAGGVSRLELREAEQSLRSQESTQSQLLQQRTETRNALTVLLNGEPWPIDDEPRDLNDAYSPEIEPGIPAELLSRRPDLRAAELRLKAQITSGEITRTRFYPSISLTGSASSGSSELRDLLENPVASLGAAFALPFLRWNEMRLERDIADVDEEIAINDFRATLYRAFTEVDNALSAKAHLAGELAAAREAYAAAQEVERIYEVRYRAGAVPLRSWLDAEERLRAAQLAVSRARLAQLQNDASLFLALGGSAP
jgi:NodT family efflux transporter outer membrane factor (OMF) lipoprotein